jgi:hypothetical protein
MWDENFTLTPPPVKRDRTVETNVRPTDPDTSRAAATTHADTRRRDRDLCYAVLQRAGFNGLTDFELAAKVGRQQTSAGKRRGELRDQGLVRDSGRRRKAPSGSLAIVWVVTR